MQLSAVLHQPRAITILRRALRSARPHHAYLFDGPDGVGKELAAAALAARYLCDADGPPDADACGACASCRLLARDNHPDYHLIHRGLHRSHPDPAVRRGAGLYLAVDVVRHFLLERSAIAPSLGRARVFVVREAERMNDGAQNALLKTLEEPPPRTRLILIATAAGRLLPTIRSRCQRVPFGPLPPAFVEERLRAAGVAADAAWSLARLADGRVGAALAWHRMRLLDALDTLTEAAAALAGNDIEGFGKAILAGGESLARRARAASGAASDDDESGDESDERAAPDGDDEISAATTGSTRALPTDEMRAGVKLALLLLAAALRDALLVRAAADAALLTFPGAKTLCERLAATAAPEDGVRAVATAEMMLDRNVTPQLAMERLGAALLGVVEPVVSA